MGYWINELGAEDARVEPLDFPARLGLAHRAVAWTVQALDPPIEEPAAAFVAEGVQRVDAAVARGSAVPDGAAEMTSRYWELVDDLWQPGAAQLCSATVLCFGTPPGLPAKSVMEIMIDCYEAVLLRATDEAITPAVERATPEAVAAVRFQKALLGGT